MADITWEDITWQDIIKFKWFKRLYVIYIFGFFINFRPSSPFVYQFLLTSKNFSENEINEDIFPLSFYSTAVQLLPIFLLLDFCKYNPLIILSSLTGIVTTCLYIWTDSLTEIQVAQVFSGSTIALETAYYVSVYAHGDAKNYQRLTSYVRAAPFVGKILATFLAQLLISQDSLTYRDLYYFDLAACILATATAIFLPQVDPQCDEKSEEKTSKFSMIFSNFIHSFPNKYVVKWSIWSIFTICVYNQIVVYIHPLWKKIQDEKDMGPFNGGMEGVYAVFALAGTILGGLANLDWKFKGDLILSFTSLLQAFFLIFVSQLEEVWLKCLLYIFYGAMFHFILTILCAEIAKIMNKGCWGLIFGGIAFIASVLNSGMVCLLNDKIGIQLYPQDLFMVYGYYHLALAVWFIVIGLTYWFAKHTYE